MTAYTNALPELYLGRDSEMALAMGPKTFRNAENAIRFAMERAAPVSRRGALLRVGGRTFGPREIARMHQRLQAPASARPGLALLLASEADSP